MDQRVLIADDDPALQDVLEIALALNSYSPQVHGTREAVVSALRTEHWDLILLDTLGAAPGEETSMLTSISKLAGSTPVLLMTGSTTLAEWAQSNLKLAGILVKPFELEPFLGRVAEAVKAPVSLTQKRNRSPLFSTSFFKRR